MIDNDLIDDDFFAEEEVPALEQKTPWNVLIVDDEEEIHRVTLMALSNFTFEGRPLRFIKALSAQQGKEAFLNNNDIAMVLLDVVMETEYAGLDLAKWIREDHGNLNVRIVLRTGQPGQAPEQAVIRDYDINDYKAKTELTAQKLYTATLTALRAYQHIVILERSKHGMEHVILATKSVMDHIGFIAFTKAALEQIMTLIKVHDSLLVNLNSHVIEIDSHQQSVQTICGTGIYTGISEQCSHLNQLPFQSLLNQALQQGRSIFTDNELVIFCKSEHHSVAFYISTDHPLSQLDKHLLEVFAENLVVGLKNIELHEQMKLSQREVIYRLTEVVESRSNETGYHVKRVAKYCELLASLYGLSEEQCEVILFASPLHDIGKVGIPDRILNKPAKLDKEEWQVMQTHAQLGETMLKGSDLELLDAGAIIAGTHHERWDGTGYPNGLMGEEIPLFGRICALADIFDALCSKRAYKEPWSMESVLEHIQSESGKFFEPRLVTLFLDNISEFLKIKEDLKDPE